MPYHTMKRPRSPEHIRKLFQKIAERAGQRRWEPAICARIDIGPYAPRNWLDRGIPEEYWPVIAELAGEPVEAVQAAHKLIQAK